MRSKIEEYQAVEALRVTFNLMDDTQKMQVIDRILAIDDMGEHMLFKDVIEIRQKYGVYDLLSV